jgi:acyl dehydratase
MADSLAYDSIEIGKRIGPFYYPLQDRIARYLEATENAHPWHHSRSPWGPPIAPPTLIGNATLRFIDSVSPVPPGTLHAKQEVETQAALRLDRHPMAYGQFVEKYERRGRRWFVFEARWREETGLLIGHTRTTMAFPEKIETSDNGSTRTAEQKKGEKTPELPAITRTLAQPHLTAYTEDSANALRGTSIHIDPVIASEAGYPKTLAQGMMAAEPISEILTNLLGKEWFANARLSLAFTKPILCGETLTASGRLASETERGAVVDRQYEVWTKDSAGDIVAVGTAASLVMPGK